VDEILYETSIYTFREESKMGHNQPSFTVKIIERNFAVVSFSTIAKIMNRQTFN